MRAQTAELAQQMITTGEVGGEWLGHLVEKLQELATASDPTPPTSPSCPGSPRTLRAPTMDLAQAYSGNGSALEILIRREERSRKHSRTSPTRSTPRPVPASASTSRPSSRSTARSATSRSSASPRASSTRPHSPRRSTRPPAVPSSSARPPSSPRSTTPTTRPPAPSTTTRTPRPASSTSPPTSPPCRPATGLRDYQDTLAASELSRGKDFLNSQGADAAAAFLAGYQAATPEQRAELNRIWTEAGPVRLRRLQRHPRKGFAGRTIAGPTVDLQEPNVDDLVNGLQSKLVGRHVRVTVIPVDRNGVEVP